MRKSLRFAVLLAAAAVSGSAMAADFGVAVSGDVHGATSYHFRGAEFSDGNPSVGFKVSAAHASGAFASLSSDTIKLTDDGRHQRLDGLDLGYATQFGGVDVSAGVSHHNFSGHDPVGRQDFTEVFGQVGYMGATAKLSHVVGSTHSEFAGISKGDAYAELGYTYHLPYHDKVSVGADLGYSFYGDKHADTKDGLSLAQLRVGYDVSKDFQVQLTHQLAQGEDAYGAKQSGNNKTYVQASYKF